MLDFEDVLLFASWFGPGYDFDVLKIYFYVQSSRPEKKNDRPLYFFFFFILLFHFVEVTFAHK